ncbi:MAG: hypothetical protein ACE5I5_16280 [Candidatus Heimdallarchaeota archaeon]
MNELERLMNGFLIFLSSLIIAMLILPIVSMISKRHIDPILNMIVVMVGFAAFLVLRLGYRINKVEKEHQSTKP